MTEIRFTRLDQLSGGDIPALVSELEQACGVKADNLASSPLINFLTLCLYPKGGASKRVSISAACLPVAPLLDTTIGKLPDGDIRTLCNELSIASDRALEFFSGSKLAAFLSKTVPKLPKPKKPTAKHSRLDRLALRRRANRR